MFPAPTPFRETIRYPAIGERKYIRYFEGRGHFAHLKIQLVPAPGESRMVAPGADLAIPEECLHAAWIAILHKLEAGPVARLPMHGLEVRFLEATYLPAHSSPEAFATVACMAFDEAMIDASPVIIEPWTRLRLPVERKALADTVATLARLLGKVDSSISVAETFYLDVEVPGRMVPIICRSLKLNPARALQLTPDQEYRAIQGSLPATGRPQSPFEDWT